jgi:hypothetical protein
MESGGVEFPRKGTTALPGTTSSVCTVASERIRSSESASATGRSVSSVASKYVTAIQTPVCEVRRCRLPFSHVLSNLHDGEASERQDHEGNGDHLPLRRLQFRFSP